MPCGLPHELTKIYFSKLKINKNNSLFFFFFHFNNKYDFKFEKLSYLKTNSLKHLQSQYNPNLDIITNGVVKEYISRMQIDIFESLEIKLNDLVNIRGQICNSPKKTFPLKFIYIYIYSKLF